MNQKSAPLTTDKTDESIEQGLLSVMSVTHRPHFENYESLLQQLKPESPLSKPQLRRLRSLVEAVCNPHEVEGMYRAAMPYGDAAIELYEAIKIDHESKF